MGEKNKPKEKKEKTQKQPSLKPKAAIDTAKGKLEGRQAAQRAKVKAGLKQLKERISRAPSGKPFSLTTKDKQLLEKAFKESLSKLNEEQIKKKLANYSITRLEKAEELQKGASARVFAKLIEATKENPIDFNYKYKKGDKIRINFQGNEDAEDSFGMRTLFKHHPEIREVKLVQKNKRGKGREGIATRRGLDGNFYFADGSYAPIFSGSEIEIVKVFTNQELENYKKTASTYTVGRTKRSISKKDQAFYRKQYAFVPPNPKDKKAVEAYWKQIDNATNKPARQTAPRVISSKEYVPKSQIEKQFKAKWEEIMRINDKEKLIQMSKEIVFRANDPIVRVPGERAGMRLRSAAALRWALFKRHAALSGYKVYISSGYRSVKHQEKLWYWGLAKRKRMFRKKYPNASEAEIHRKAVSLNRRYVAPPGKSHHNTGGAVDISIYKNGKKIQMHKFTRQNSRAQYNHALTTGDLSALSSKNKKALRARLFLENTLKASAFLGTNYINETWHWNIDKDPRTRRSVYRNV